MKSKQIIYNTNTEKYIITGITSTITSVMLVAGTTAFGAPGMAYTLYSAIIGAIIFGAVGYSLNHTLEAISFGTALGATIGVIISMLKHREEIGIDKNNYAKAAECISKAVIKHVPDTIEHSTGNWISYSKLINSFDDIKDCIGGDGHNIFYTPFLA